MTPPFWFASGWSLSRRRSWSSEGFLIWQHRRAAEEQWVSENVIQGRSEELGAHGAKLASASGLAARPKATLGDDVGRHSKLRSQFYVSGNRVGNEAVFLHLCHDRSGGRDISLASQDQGWPNADFNNPVFAVDVCQQTFCGAFIGHKLQPPTLGERDKRQHHAGIQRGDQHFFGSPDARVSLEFRRAADLDIGFAGCGRSAAASGVPDQVIRCTERTCMFSLFPRDPPVHIES